MRGPFFVRDVTWSNSTRVQISDLLARDLGYPYMLQDGRTWFLLADERRVAAPPQALGLLRAMLPDTAKARIRAHAPKDLLDEDLAQLRERLNDLLR